MWGLNVAHTPQHERHECCHWKMQARQCCGCNPLQTLIIYTHPTSIGNHFLHWRLLRALLSLWHLPNGTGSTNILSMKSQRNLFTKNNHLKVKQHKEGHRATVSSTQERQRQRQRQTVTERQRQRVTEKTKLQCCNCVFPQVVTRILRSGCKIEAWIFRETVEHQGLLWS